MTEDELRMAVSRSQKEGFRLLFRQYYPYVYHIVWNRIRTVGTKEDAEECVSDIFAELFSQFDKVENGALQGFLGTLARRRAVNLFHRLAGHDPALPLDEEIVGQMASEEQIEEDLEAAHLQKTLLRHIRDLGEPDAQILLLRYFYGCNSAEIARTLRMHPVTVRVRMSRALRKLKERLTADPDFTENGVIP
ncbi:MAG: sigma-70 family RNA polymerase sigma factor [Oscillospiraceae bacterium]|nr:sigma-70 family RNA polymerase sigma factor [Oscillospiraceae bacterium]MBR1898381.1 sigma-70 family RNA polymerase sigma factor [Oscillospiraceae bacterium]